MRIYNFIFRFDGNVFAAICVSLLPNRIELRAAVKAVEIELNRVIAVRCGHNSPVTQSMRARSLARHT